MQTTIQHELPMDQLVSLGETKLIELRLVIEERISSIEEQLEKATDEDAAGSWWRRAKHSLRKKKLYVKRICLAMRHAKVLRTANNRKINEERHRTECEFFVMAASKFLSKGDFVDVWAIADRLQSSKEAEDRVQ